MPHPALRQPAAIRTPVGDTGPFVPDRNRPVRLRARSIPADSQFEPHRHTWAQLAYCASGVLQVTATRCTGATEEVAFIVPPSRAVWVAPGALHQVQAMEAAHLRTLYIDAGAVPTGFATDCRVLMVTALLRELIEALDRAGGRREALLAALVLDEIARATPQSIGVPLPDPRAATSGCARCARPSCARRPSAPRWPNGQPTSVPASAPWRGCSRSSSACRIHAGASRRCLRMRCRCSRAARPWATSRRPPAMRADSAFSAMFPRRDGPVAEAFHARGPGAPATRGRRRLNPRAALAGRRGILMTHWRPAVRVSRGLRRAVCFGKLTAWNSRTTTRRSGSRRPRTADEIKKAYRKLARKYHPDVSKEPDAAARMSDVNEANAVLSDPEKRTAYDELGRQPHAGREFRPPPNWDAGYEFSGGGAGPAGQDFSDFFEELFGRQARAARAGGAGGMGGAGRRAEPSSFRGEDHHAKIELDLLDAYQGAERAITLRGAHLDAQGHAVTDERTLNVSIPKGVREGQQIRLAGQGSAGYGGGANGDLFLEVVFKPDVRFRVQGRDVTQSVPLAPWEAALGAQIEVPTPTGTIEVTVPGGWKKGKKLRLKGRGIPAASPGGTAGDMYLELEVALPPADSARAREIYGTMQREMPFDPRAAG